MLSLACFLLLAASRVQLADEVYQIPASEWRYVELALKQQPATVMARYDVMAGPPKLRLALLQREDLEKLRAGAPHSVIDVTREAARGALDYPVLERGDYVLVIDNQGREPRDRAYPGLARFRQTWPGGHPTLAQAPARRGGDQLSRVLWNRELFRAPPAADNAPVTNGPSGMPVRELQEIDGVGRGVQTRVCDVTVPRCGRLRELVLRPREQFHCFHGRLPLFP